LEYKYKSITDIIFEREKKGEVSSRTNKVKMSADNRTSGLNNKDY